MKSTFYLFIAFFTLSFASFAQKTKESTRFEPVQEIEKKTAVENNNSTNHTSEIGNNEGENVNKIVSYREVFGDDKKQIQVQIKEANGKKKMKLTEYVNGKERVTMYEGEEVNKKLKELEARYPGSKQ